MAAHPYLDTLNQGLADASASMPPMESLTVPQFRDMLVQLNAHEQVPGVNRNMISVPISGGTDTWIYTPEGAKSPLPYIYFIHGGGFIAGNISAYDSIVTDLVLRTGYAVVFPEYKLAPESQWPEQQEQCFDVLEWFLQNGKNHSVVPDNFAVLADSAAGVTGFNVNLIALKKNVKIPYNVLLNPVASLDFAGKPPPSRAEFWNGPYLTVSAIRTFSNYYLPDSVDRTSEEASPMNVSNETASVFPPTLILTASADILRDEAEILGQKLQQAGRDVAIIRSDGQLHDSAALQYTRSGPTPKAVMTLIAASLKERLG
ncbi:Alpha/Beta hydrolase protein [Hypoxylon sp. NC1633]|nr:Alpha/Beta hydrolase protein [Hypoxylon sp. NC1633]